MGTPSFSLGSYNPVKQLSLVGNISCSEMFQHQFSFALFILLQLVVSPLGYSNHITLKNAASSGLKHGSCLTAQSNSAQSGKYGVKVSTFPVNFTRKGVGLG